MKSTRIRARHVLAAASVLAASLFAFETSAQTNAVRGCAPAPRSPLVVDIKSKGAKGDGRTNDTAALQAAIDAVAGTGGTLLVPNGTYMIDAAGKVRATLKSDMTLKLAAGATLKVNPNGADVYALLSLAGASNVTIEGGTLEGDRKEHSANTGEWGMGLRIEKGARNVTISGVTIRKMWGDGIYVAGASNVNICALTADRNRRQGLSVIAVDGLTVTNSLFKDTKGTRPAAGIDLEPNGATEVITNVRIESSKFNDNEGPGILIAGKKGTISNLEIKSNVFEGTLPIVVEDAREVADGGICRNRLITRPTIETGGFSSHSEAIPVVIAQEQCGDRRLMVRRGKGKK